MKVDSIADSKLEVFVVEDWEHCWVLKVVDFVKVGMAVVVSDLALEDLVFYQKVYDWTV